MFFPLSIPVKRTHLTYTNFMGAMQEKAQEEEEKGDQGEHQGKKSKKKGDQGSGEGKKAGGGGDVVLKVDLHCDGCALKVKKAIKAAQGVEGVSMDMAAGTVTVSGKPDPWDLKERVESRAQKAVVFVSPANPPKKKKEDCCKKPAAAAAYNGNAGKGKSKNSNPNDEKKNKEPPESTVVLKIRFHCNGCIDRIKRTTHKVKGVKEVTVDTAKEQVTVKGTMDPKALPGVLKDKLKRDVTVVPIKKENGGDGGGEKKDKKGGNDDKKKDKKDKGEEDKKKQEDVVKEKQMAAAMAAEMDGWKPVVMDPAAMYGGGYRMEMLHAPQLFSDENPNACSVM